QYYARAILSYTQDDDLPRSQFVLPADRGEAPVLADGGLAVDVVVDQHRHDPVVDQVPAMDSVEGLGEYRPHAQLERGQGGVLPARALPVVVAGHDEAAAPFLRPGHELGVLLAEAVLRD